MLILLLFKNEIRGKLYIIINKYIIPNIYFIKENL